MEAAALRKEAEMMLEALPDEKEMDDELTLVGKTLDDLTPEWREAFERDSDPSFLSRPFKTVEEAMAALMSEGEDEFDA